MFCSLWGVLASAGLSPPLFPTKSVQAEDKLVPRTLQSCHTLHPVLIISLAGTLTGLSRGPFPSQWQEGLSSGNFSLVCCFQSLLMSCSCRWCFSLGLANMPPIQPEVGIAAFCKMSSQFIKYVQILEFIMCWPVLLLLHASLATPGKPPPPPLSHPGLDQLMKL